MTHNKGMQFHATKLRIFFSKSLISFLISIFGKKFSDKHENKPNLEIKKKSNILFYSCKILKLKSDKISAKLS